MFQRASMIVLLVTLTVLAAAAAANELHGFYYFKDAPYQLKKRTSKQPSISNPWCYDCEGVICRIVDVNGRFDRKHSDCGCSISCFCLYSETRKTYHIYRCMPA